MYSQSILLLVLALNILQTTTANYADQIQIVERECVKELGIPTNGPPKEGAQAPNFNCLTKCILQKLNFMDDKGEVNTTGLPDLFLKPVEKCADELRDKEICTRANYYLKCAGEKLIALAEIMFDECEEETGIKVPVDRYPSGDMDLRVFVKLIHVKEYACFARCVALKANIINDANNNVDLSAYSDFMPTYDKIDEFQKVCNDITNADKCEEAQMRGQCVYNSTVKLYY